MFEYAAANGNPFYGALAFLLVALGNIALMAVLFVALAPVAGSRLGRWITAKPGRAAAITGAALIVAGEFTFAYWGLRVPSRYGHTCSPTTGPDRARRPPTDRRAGTPECQRWLYRARLAESAAAESPAATPSPAAPRGGAVGSRPCCSSAAHPCYPAPAGRISSRLRISAALRRSHFSHSPFHTQPPLTPANSRFGSATCGRDTPLKGVSRPQVSGIGPARRGQRM